MNAPQYVMDFIEKQGWADVAFTFDEGGTVLVLFRPYSPLCYPDECVTVDGYYLVSNETYFWGNDLISFLQQNGIAAEREAGGWKGAALRTGKTVQGWNGLTLHPQFGSYFVLCVLRLRGVFWGEPPKTEIPMCCGCGRCREVCSTGAIGKDGLQKTSCLRYAQENAVKDETLLRLAGKKLLGCSDCQDVCPLNAHRTLPAPPELCDILKKEGLAERLARPEVLKVLGKYIGKNYARKNMLATLAKFAEERENPVNKGKKP
mgnify:FL=1